jgi:3-deoxy-D-manno-octulosonic-acid transferase
MALRIYRNLLRKFARLRLVIVPRHPPRFDEVQQIIEDHQLKCLRLTRVMGAEYVGDSALPPVVLIDAMGILRDFYSVGTVVFVGRSIVDLGPRQHGSDMIEPSALAKPVIVGPYTANFAEAMRKFKEADAIMEVSDEESLEQAIAVLLSTPGEAMAMGKRAQDVVRSGQGATQIHERVILQILHTARGEEDVPPTERGGGGPRQPSPLRPSTPIPSAAPQLVVNLPKPPPKVIITSISAPPPSNQ